MKSKERDNTKDAILTRSDAQLEKFNINFSVFHKLSAFPDEPLLLLADPGGRLVDPLRRKFEILHGLFLLRDGGKVQRLLPADDLKGGGASFFRGHVEDVLQGVSGHPEAQPPVGSVVGLSVEIIEDPVEVPADRIGPFLFPVLNVFP